MSAYCTTADVYRWIAPGSVSNPARLIADVETTTEILTLDAHGLELDQKVVFRPEAGGSLPSPLVEGTTYYAIPLTDSTFSVAATPSGAAIDLTTAGVNVLLITELPWDAWIAEASAELESTLPAHAVPLQIDGDGAYPAIVVSYCAGIVASKALRYGGVRDPALTEELKFVRSELDRWRRGKSLRGAGAQSSTNLAVRGSVRSSDPRGWAAASGGNKFIP